MSTDTSVAEGTETREQVALVREAGFRFAQGDYFGAAAPPEELADRLCSGRIRLTVTPA